MSSINNKMGHARSVTDVYKHVPMRAHTGQHPSAHAHHRVSTYSNVSVPVGTSTNRFGSSDTRASYNAEHRRAGAAIPAHNGSNQLQLQRSIVYRSNSSLDLDHEVAVVQEAVSSVNLRQFGSQGSIHDLKSFDPPAASSTLQRRPVTSAASISADTKSEVSSVLSDTSSPKLSKKKSSLFTNNQKLFKKFKVTGSTNQSSIESADGSGNNLAAERQASLDDRHRRRFFSHYDIGSLSASLSVSAHMKSQEKRNTGASAASAALRGIEDTSGEEVDHGDQVSNDLVLR